MSLDSLWHIPLWSVFLLTSLFLFIAFETGIFLGKIHRRAANEEDTSPIGSIVGATLGLLAFMLAFTFGIATTKFEERRSLVIEEANAIGTTYLRAGYLAEPQKSNIRTLLKEYVSTSLDALKPGKLAQDYLKAEELLDKLWENATIVAEKHPDSIVAGLFIQSLNEAIDLRAKRVNVGIRVRIPPVIWVFLYMMAAFAIGTVGYQIGLTKSRYVGISILLILTFSSVITLIADLDRPLEGFVKVSQQSLIDLQDKFK